MLTTSDYTDYWKTPDLAIEEYYDDYPDIPLLLETSWYGHHITATLAKYAELKKRHKTPKRLLIGTWLHGGEHHRNRVESPRSGHGAAVDGHVVGDPVVDQQLAGLPDPVGELGRFQVAERSSHLGPVLAHPVGAHQLVVGPGPRSVPVDEVRGGVGGHGGEAGPGTGRRRSRVRGYPSPRDRWASRGATAIGPGVCPDAVNRDPRRDSASLAFTGKVS